MSSKGACLYEPPKYGSTLKPLYTFLLVHIHCPTTSHSSVIDIVADTLCVLSPFMCPGKIHSVANFLTRSNVSNGDSVRRIDPSGAATGMRTHNVSLDVTHHLHIAQDD